MVNGALSGFNAFDSHWEHLESQTKAFFSKYALIFHQLKKNIINWKKNINLPCEPKELWFRKNTWYFQLDG